MADLWFRLDRASGRRGVARFCRSALDYGLAGDAPVPRGWRTVTLDCHTNADLCADLAASTDAYALADDLATVLKDGQPVAIAPPAPDSLLALPPEGAPEGSPAARTDWLIRRLRRGRT